MGLTFDQRTVSNKNFVPYVVGKVKASDFFLEMFLYKLNICFLCKMKRWIHIQYPPDLKKILHDPAREDMHVLPTKGGEVTTLDGKKYTITNSCFEYKEITQKEPSYTNYK